MTITRRELFVAVAATPVLLADGGATAIQDHLPLSAHDQNVLRILRQNLYTMNHHIDVDEMMHIYTGEYRRSIVRHVAGVQPMLGPTHLAFVTSDNCWRPATEVAHDWKVICGQYLKPPPSFHNIQTVSITAATGTIPESMSLSEYLDRKIIRTLSYASLQTDDWNVLNAPGRIAVIHPTNANVIAQKNVVVSPYMPVTFVLVVEKQNEYDAQIFYNPYIPLYGKGRSTRYSLCMNIYQPKTWKISV